MSDASTLFEMLAARPRRRVLLSLRDAESVRIAELVADGDQRDPARGGQQVSIQRTTGPDAERAAVEFHHEHLPKLAAAGLIEWEPGTGQFARGPEFGSVRPALDLIAENDGAFPDDLV